MADISNDDDIIDTRQLIEAIEEIEVALEDADEPVTGADREEMLDELNVLRAFASECEGFDDYRYGVTLVRDSYWHIYAEEYAEEIGAINREYEWPHSCIDWEQAARELQMDYTPVTFDGVTYWGR